MDQTFYRSLNNGLFEVADLMAILDWIATFCRHNSEVGIADRNAIQDALSRCVVRSNWTSVGVLPARSAVMKAQANDNVWAASGPNRQAGGPGGDREEYCAVNGPLLDSGK